MTVFDDDDIYVCVLCSANVKHSMCRPEAIDPSYGVELTLDVLPEARS